MLRHTRPSHSASFGPFHGFAWFWLYIWCYLYGVSTTGYSFRFSIFFPKKLLFRKRFDLLTAASLLQAFLEVVNPPALRGLSDVVKGIHTWEAKVGMLADRYNEILGAQLKTAILVGMLPKEFQDMCVCRKIVCRISFLFIIHLPCVVHQWKRFFCGF